MPFKVNLLSQCLLSVHCRLLCIADKEKIETSIYGNWYTRKPTLLDASRPPLLPHSHRLDIISSWPSAVRLDCDCSNRRNNSTFICCQYTSIHRLARLFGALFVLPFRIPPTRAVCVLFFFVLSVGFSSRIQQSADRIDNDDDDDY